MASATARAFKIRKKFETLIRDETTIRKKDHFHQIAPHAPKIFSHFKSFSHFFTSLYPSLRLTLFDVDFTSRSHWLDPDNERRYLDSLRHRLPIPIARQADWLLFSDQMLRAHQGRALLNYNSNSVRQFLSKNLKEFFWERQWGYSPGAAFGARRAYVDGFLLSLSGGPVTQQDLQALRKRAIAAREGGGTLLTFHGSSPAAIFTRAYPELPLEAPLGVRDALDRKRIFVDRYILRQPRAVSRKADLLIITCKHLLQSLAGTNLLHVYHGTPQECFEEVYPQLILFEGKSCFGYWKELKSGLILRTIQFYCLKRKEDWYRLSEYQLAEFYGKIVRKGNLVQQLKYSNPEEEWVRRRFSDVKKKSRQRYLGRVLMEVLKGEVVLEEYSFRTPERIYFFDFYVPGLKVVVEYQGEQHYYPVSNWISLEEQRKRDAEKVNVCRSSGLELITVPYWWDNSRESLEDIIKSQISI